MGVLPSIAVRRRGIRARRWIPVFVALASLAVVPIVRADPGGTTNPDTPAASDDASAAGNGGGGSGAAKDPQGNAVTAPDDTADRPGSAGDRTGGSDNSESDGGSGDSESSDGGQRSSADSPRRADDGPAADDDGAEHRGDVDQNASVDQKADASASAGQRNVDNTSVAVRIDEPGNGKKVGQANVSAADAAASVSAVGTTGSTTGSKAVQQEADADAGAAQSGVSNTSVVVRVGSPGDDEGATQLNLSTGNATASATADGLVSGSGNATSGATQDGVTNTSVSVRVFSPGDDGPVSQVNAASATSHASAEDASEYAVALQDGAQNTSVSIRVESAGSSAAPTQQNQTRAEVSPVPGDGAGSVAVAVSSDSRNTTLEVAVGGGADLDRPGPAGLQVWIWNWAWQRDESESLDGLGGAAMTSWTWNWDGGNTAVPGGTITSRAAGEGDNEPAGSWEWSWEWSRTGVAGWAWGWNWDAVLPCSSCVWIWNWTWSWAGEPRDDGSTVLPVPAAVNGPSSATQLNAAQAQASAAATAGVVQVVSQDAAEGGTQSAAQLTAVVQDAGAFADAQQADVGALAWRADHLDQSNLVGSAAAVALSGTIAQSIDQVVDVADRAVALQWGGQEADIAQAGRADAASSQRDAVLTGPGAHAAGSVASAAGTAAVDQQLFQDGVLGGGVLSQWAGQLVLVEQALDADATVVQTGTRRSRLVGGTAGAFATAADLALIDQFAGQSATRVTGTGSQAILQAAYAAQDASAHGATTQQAGCCRAARCAQRGRGPEQGGDGARRRSELVCFRCPRRPGHLADVDRGSAGRRVVRLVRWDRRPGRGPQLRRDAPGRGPVHRTRGDPSAHRPESVLLTRGAPPRLVARRLRAFDRDGRRAARGKRPSVRHGAGCSCGRRRGGNELRRRQSGRGRCPGAAPARRTDRRRALGAPPGAPRAGTVTHPRVFRPAPLHASAPRHAPAEPCGDRRRRSGAAASAGGRSTTVGLRTRSSSIVRRRALGDRSDPRGLRARAAASAAGARRVGRQAADRRPLTGRRPGLTFRHAT